MIAFLTVHWLTSLWGLESHPSSPDRRSLADRLSSISLEGMNAPTFLAGGGQQDQSFGDVLALLGEGGGEEGLRPSCDSEGEAGSGLRQNYSSARK